MKDCAYTRMLVALLVAIATEVGFARTFDFKTIGSKGTVGEGSYWSSSKYKNMTFQIKVGSAFKNDDRSPMEIRAATVLRNMSNKSTGINDITSLRFDPINTSKAIYFSVVSGSARESSNYGWQVAGCIIEIWQNKKLVRHWSNIPGNLGRTSLVGKIEQLRIDKSGHSYSSEYREFNNSTSIYASNQDGERVDLEAVLSEFRTDEEKSAARSDEVFSPGLKYFVRDPRYVSEDMIRRVLEGNSERSYFYSDDGIVKKDVRTQQDVDDFKLVNPKCVMFNSYDELKSFVRKLKSGDASVQPRSERLAERQEGDLPRQSSRRASSAELVQAELDHDEDMRRKKLGLPPLARKRPAAETSGATSDAVSARGAEPPVFDVVQLNSELRIKSFCGIKFGEVLPDISPSSGRGASMPQKFRCFTSATRWGSPSRNRVGRIELTGKVQDLDEDSVRQEVEDVARIVGKKYGVTFSPVRRSSFSSGSVSLTSSYSCDDYAISVSAYTSNENTRFSLSFTNNQVEEQNKAFQRLIPKKSLNLSEDEGADVL